MAFTTITKSPEGMQPPGWYYDPVAKISYFFTARQKVELSNIFPPPDAHLLYQRIIKKIGDHFITSVILDGHKYWIVSPAKEYKIPFPARLRIDFPINPSYETISSLFKTGDAPPIMMGENIVLAKEDDLLLLYVGE